MHPRPRARTTVALIAALLLAALLASCGDDDDSAASTGTSAPAGADGGDGADGDAASGDTPERIVSLSPSATEMLFAIDAGDLVVAVDDQSNYPAEAPVTDLSGYTPNVEAIAGYEPDLVIFANDLEGIESSLAALGIETLLLPAATTLDDSYAQIEQLGAITGHVAEAAEVVLDLQTRIDEAVARVPETDAPLTYYHELDNTLYTVTSKTFLGELYALAGLQNIADPADTSGAGYPQLSAEFIVDQDPDIVFLADTKCCGQNADTFAQRPGFDALTAVKTGAIVELDDDIASRWGPRTADLLETIVDAVEKLPESAKAG
jgi:iron complex transport system substrate-binding protein